MHTRAHARSYMLIHKPANDMLAYVRACMCSYVRTHTPWIESEYEKTALPMPTLSHAYACTQLQIFAHENIFMHTLSLTHSLTHVRAYAAGIQDWALQRHFASLDPHV